MPWSMVVRPGCSRMKKKYSKKLLHGIDLTWVIKFGDPGSGVSGTDTDTDTDTWK